MQILHLTERFASAGGIETYVRNLLPLLETRGHTSTVVYRQAHPRDEAADGVNAIHLPRSESLNQDLVQYRRLVRQIQPDLIYIHDVYEPEIISMVSEMAPSVAYVHIFYPVCPGLGKLYHRGDEICRKPYGLGCVPQIYLRRCASARSPLSVYKIMRTTAHFLDAYRQLPSILVASTYMRDLLVQNGIEPDRLHIAPCFLPDGLLTQQPHDLPESPSILFVGRLDYEKGIPYLLEAVSNLDTPHRLRIVGDGSLMSDYVELSEKLKIQDHVEFLGWLTGEDLTEAYRAASVVVMPSIMAEPFGIVGIEAMAHARPVVAFDVGGISDWLHSGVSGYLVPPLNVDEMAKRLNQLLADRSLSEQMGKQGREIAAEFYPSSKHIESLDKIFQGLDC